MTKERLGIKAKGRRVTAQNSSYELREPAAPYRDIFGVKNGLLRLETPIFGTKYNRYQADSVVRPQLQTPLDWREFDGRSVLGIFS